MGQIKGMELIKASLELQNVPERCPLSRPVISYRCIQSTVRDYFSEPSRRVIIKGPAVRLIQEHLGDQFWNILTKAYYIQKMSMRDSRIQSISIGRETVSIALLHAEKV